MDKPWNKRGRGRGSTNPNASIPASKGRGNRKAGEGKRAGTGDHWNNSYSHKLSAEARFQQTSAKHKKDAKEILQTFEDYYQSSSEEDELDDISIISKLTKSYKGLKNTGSDQNEGNLESTTQYLMECCQSGAITCLVCISSVKRQNSVWSCEKCYAIFHLNCIKQWVLEGIAQATLLSDEYFPNRDQPWFCPKCRHEYARSKCPESYFCFCGSEQDPTSDPWLLPHSCGGTCNKLLQSPACGHACLLLCHPGPCPPCPQTILLACHCGKEPPSSRRCGSGKWSCGKTCSKPLACRRHKCQMVCHSGECTQCTQNSMQACVCGSERRIQPCMQPQWSCVKTCSKLLLCGSHRCEKICHKLGECGECPRSGIRTCPCGKQTFDDLACTEDVTICQDTCGKSLGCYGNHKCSRRCHFGPCGSCPLMAVKVCRCGKHKRELPCQKEYICEEKCTKLRSCGNHQCRRKCCSGRCPPCEQVCSRTLRCKRHKCQMLCHKGPCYPCPKTSKVACFCGYTSVTVICGKEKAIKPPRCRRQCQISSNCHHPTRLPHTCHFDACPKCVQICQQSLPCGHICPVTCHDNVMLKNEVKATAPWEMPQSTYQVKTLPCPPCKVPVPVVCRGGHETGKFACSEARDYSCGRPCGRQLQCGNHTCSTMCHVVTDAEDDAKAGSNCTPCEEPCVKPRNEGCTHECVSLCHTGECPPCRKRIRMRCHCGMVALKHLCCEWSGKSMVESERMASCGNHCPKMLEFCGHMCPLQCHPGACPSSEECNRKTTLRCPCRRKKKDYVCSVVFIEKCEVSCDDKCMEIKAMKAAEKAEEERKVREEEERKQQEEIEKFERKMNKKSRPRKRRNSIDENKSLGKWEKLVNSRAFRISRYVIVVAAAITVVVAAYYQTEI